MSVVVIQSTAQDIYFSSNMVFSATKQEPEYLALMLPSVLTTIELRRRCQSLDL